MRRGKASRGLRSSYGATNDFTVVVEIQPIMFILNHELHSGFGLAIFLDAQQDEPVLRGFLEKTRQRWKRRNTWRAPSGPEIQEYRTALKRSQRKHFAVRRIESHIRSGLAHKTSWRECRALNSVTSFALDGGANKKVFGGTCELSSSAC